MNSSVTDLFIQHFDFWPHLSEAEKDLISAHTNIVRYAKGTQVHQGPLDCIGVLLIKSGQLRVYTMSEDGREVTLYRLFPDDVGILSAACALDAVTFDEVMDLFYSLRAPYRRNSVFIMNDSTVKALRKLKDGQGQYLWQPAVTAATPDTILNRPVYTSTFMPTLATGNKTILFGDLGYYWVADREGRSFKRLNELYAPTGQVGFLASQRVDGKLILPEAVKVLQQA